PFDAARSYELYQALLAPFANLTRDKHLLIVPAGPLTSLPFHVLITEPPAASRMAAYRELRWLVLKQALSVLPSVGSLHTLRKLTPSQATEPYIAFGNPLLVGARGTDRRAWTKQTCKPETARIVEGRGNSRGGVSLRSINLAQLRAQAPLP